MRSLSNDVEELQVGTEWHCLVETDGNKLRQHSSGLCNKYKGIVLYY